MTATGSRGDTGQALALYLREHPEAALLPPEELAAQFGLPRDFVAQVQFGLQGPHGGDGPLADAAWKSLFMRCFQRARLAFRYLTNKPILFVFVTLVLAIVASALLAALGDTEAAIDAFGRPLLWQASTLVGVGILHLACYYRHAMVRYALFGGLVCWLTLAPVNMIVRWTEINDLPMNVVTANLLIESAMTLVLAAQYTLVACGAAVLGGLAWFRRREREIRGMSRHQLLQRRLDILERLQDASTIAEEVEPSLRRKVAQAFQKLWPVWSALLGMTFSGLYMAFVTLFGGPMPSVVRSLPMLAVSMAGFFLLDLVVLALIGFLSSRPLTALLAAWTYQAASVLLMTLPIPGFGLRWVVEHYARPTPIVTLMLLTTAIALIASLGAQVDEKVERQRRLEGNDPAALLAELVRIEWLLAPHPTEVCVLAVDVVRSAEMKGSADSLDIEYSFREYQDLLRRVAEAQNGHVHSTAGDGAVLVFPDAEKAFAAARRIRTEIDRFNRTVNRLEKPFRLRMGLHSGSVPGELDKVQFSEVIDIAAHVQDAAPVGGITVTENVASKLPREKFAPLQNPVDGHRVYLALDPVEDV